MRCSTTRGPVVADLKPGLVLHYPNCHVSILIISDATIGETIDWATGKTAPIYPAIAYIHGMGSQSTTCPVFSPIFHVAEIQKLELEA